MHDNKLVFSVDGGGSSSDGVIYDPSGNEVDRVKVGPLSLKSSSPDVVSESMRSLFSFLKGRFEDIGSCVFALSGLDSDKDITDVISIMANIGFFEESPEIEKIAFSNVVKGFWGFPVILCSDALMPLFANGFEAGSVIIAGTGSIAIHLGLDGSTTRYGGWGYAVSDSGSGTWVGMEYLREILKTCDRSTSSIQAGNDVSDRDARCIECACDVLFDAEDPINKVADPISRIHTIEKWSIRNSDPKIYASLAKAILGKAYEHSSDVCSDIARMAANHLFNLATLSFDPACPNLVFAGGLFKNRDFADDVTALVSRKCAGISSIVINKKDMTLGGMGIADLIGSRISR